MHKVGYALLLISGLIWVLGARSVCKENYKRLGKIYLTFEIPYVWKIKQYNALEKRKLLLFFLAAIIVGGIGPALANGSFD